MDNKYSVKFGNENIGYAFVRSHGLYYHIDCQCEKPDDNVYKLIAIGKSLTVDVGICVPANNRFVFNGKLPQNKFPNDIIHFALKIHKLFGAEMIVQLLPDKEFHYISKLAYGKICRLGDGIGVMFSESF